MQKFNKEEHKNLIIIASSSAISKIGSIIFDYTNSVVLVSLNTKSSLLIAVYQSLQTVIGAIVNNIGGVISDRNNQKKVLIFCDLTASLICIGLALFFDKKWIPYIIFLSNSLLTIVYGFSSPAKKSITKSIVRKKLIITFNGKVETINQIVKTLTPLVAVYIVNFLGARISILIDALSFLLSAIILINIKEEFKEEKISNKKSFFSELINGWKYVLDKKSFFLVICFASSINFILAGYNLLLPYSDKYFYFKNVKVYALFLILESIGGIIGAFATSKKLKLLTFSHIESNLFGCGTCLLGLTLSYVITKNIIILSIFEIMFNAYLTSFNIQFYSLIQKKVEKQYIGRIFGTIFATSVILMPAGSIFFTKVLNVTSIWNMFYLGISIYIVTEIYLIIKKRI